MKSMNAQSRQFFPILVVIGALVLSLSAPLLVNAGGFLLSGSLITPRQNPAAVLLADGRVLVIGGSNGAAVIDTAEVYDPAAGISAAAGKMISKRRYFSATSLPNGKVLIAGGDRSADGVSTAELFDPTTGTWTLTGSMKGVHISHTATLLTNGQVLVTGSTDIESSPSAELYDPAAGTWSMTGAPAISRNSHRAVLLPNGKVLVTGGVDQDRVPLSNVELYDPATGKWASTGAMISPRFGHAMVLLQSGKVLVAGGEGSTGEPLASTEAYDQATGKWTAGTSLSAASTDITATVLLDGTVVVVLRDDSNNVTPKAEAYNPESGVWTYAGFPQAAGAAAIPLPNGKVLFAGQVCELYDSAAVGWVPTGAPAIARVGHSLTRLGDGNVLAAGGGVPDGAVALSSAELFDPVSGKWSPTGPMKTARRNHSAVTLANGRVLVVGGIDSKSKPVVRAEVYTPATGTWAPTAVMTQFTEAHTATLLADGRVLVTGKGGNDFAPIYGAEVYDPTKDSWTITGPLKTKQTFQTATLLPNGKVLVVSGTSFALSAELYDPVTGNWALTESLAGGRGPSGARTILLPNGSALVVSGGGVAAELFDPVLEKWTTTGSLRATEEILGAAAVLNNGNAIVTGESSFILLGSVTTAESYDPVTGRWSAIPSPSLPFRASDYTTTSLADGRILLVGVRDEGRDGIFETTAQIYGQAEALNDPPTIGLSTPVDGAVLTQGVNVTIAATALDGDGTVTNVSFFSGGGLIGHAASPPYSVDWNPPSAGLFLLTARAMDNRGATTLSAPIQITVIGMTNTPPTVSMTEPRNGMRLPQGSSVVISALATDTDGVVTNVSFFSGTTLLGEVSAAPYSVIWSNLVAGTYSLTAHATDNQGLSTVSAPVQIFVESPPTNMPPLVSIQYPVNGFEIIQGANLLIAAFAADNDGSVNQVRFFNGTTLLGQATSPPYRITWSNLVAGSFTLTAEAADDQGATTISAPVQVRVVAPPNNEPPTVRILDPRNGAKFSQGGSISIVALAADRDGSITNVNFFNGTKLIGQAAVIGPPSPEGTLYSYIWRGPDVGSISLTAQATDDHGATTISAPVQVVVETLSPPELQITTADGQVILSWSASATGFLLQSAAHLDSPVPWFSVPGNPGNASGRNWVTNDTSVGQQFYRLFKP